MTPVPGLSHTLFKPVMLNLEPQHVLIHEKIILRRAALMVSHLSKGRTLGLCLATACIHELLVNLILGKIYNSSWVCFDNVTLNFISFSTSDGHHILLDLPSKYICCSLLLLPSISQCPSIICLLGYFINFLSGILTSALSIFHSVLYTAFRVIIHKNVNG